VQQAVPMTKKEIRTIYKAKRNELHVSQKAKMDDLLLIHFQQLPIWIPALVMTYAPHEKMNEFDPQYITDYCFFKNPEQVLFYPVMGADDEISCVVVNDNTTFAANQYGISEPVDGLPMFPEEIDLVILPLLAFDRNGYRVGYGKGCYDKFLKECREDVMKIGFSYFEPVEMIDDINAFDVKMDYCITPQHIYAFNDGSNN
jgi:5-formyltetrahydrofolate cyclo-ligase